MSPTLLISSLTKYGATLIAGTRTGLYYSDNVGESWNDMSIGLAERDILSVSANDNAVVLGTFGMGAFYSTNYGVTWSGGRATATKDGNVWAVAITNNGYYAGSTNGGVSRSIDGGATWSYVNRGLQSLRVSSLLTMNDSTMMVATMFGGVAFLAKQNNYWESINEGLENLGVQVLAADRQNCLAGTYNGGVWIRPKTEMVATDVDEDESKHEIARIHPNPASSMATIRTGDASLIERISIYSGVGLLVESCDGSHDTSMSISCEQLPVGLHYVILQTSNGRKRLRLCVAH